MSVELKAIWYDEVGDDGSQVHANLKWRWLGHSQSQKVMDEGGGGNGI